MRLTKYIKEKHPDFSSKEIKRALENGACKVNGEIEVFGSREINPSKDQIQFKPQKFKAQAKLEIKKDRIIYEDEDLLVYNKEAGHACMVTEGKKINLHEELKKELKLKYLEPAHRIDKDTSGLIVFCKNKNTINKMMQAFKERTVEKTYLALVDGKWSQPRSGTIKNFLELEYKKLGIQKWKVSRVAKAIAEKNKNKFKASESDYQVIKSNKDSSLVEVKPKTGRTHQIRIHLAQLGHPILGDSLYAKSFKSKKLFARHLLHAYKLDFTHPSSQKRLKLKATPTKEFRESGLK